MSVAEARAKLDQPKPEAFKFDQPGDEIAGKVTGFDLADTTYGKVKIVVIDPSDGHLRSIWLVHGALKSQMARIRPVIGDAIAVRYLGETESANGRTYHDYAVATDREQVFSWDAEPKQQEQNPFDGEPPF